MSIKPLILAMSLFEKKASVSKPLTFKFTFIAKPYFVTSSSIFSSNISQDSLSTVLIRDSYLI